MRREACHLVRTFLVSYADGRAVHRHNQRALARSAVGRGIDVVLDYGRQSLSAEFRREHRHILERARGAGYWLWKPYVVRDAMARANEGDILVYADSGLVVRRSLTPLIECAERHGLVLVENMHPNAGYVKRDCFVLTGTDHVEHHRAEQLDASFFLVKNTSANRTFVDTWLGYCQDERILTDEPNRCGLPNLSGFVEHRHDQAVLSVLFSRERTRLEHALCRQEIKADYLRRHRREVPYVPIVVWLWLPARVRFAITHLYARGWHATLRRGVARLRHGPRPIP